MLPSTAPSSRALVRAEVLRAAVALVLLPFQAGVYLATRRRARAELVRLLDAPAEVARAPLQRPLPERPLRIFVSCAEASGELHAVSLVRRLREIVARAGGPPPEFAALGGVRLEAEGVLHVGRPVEHAAMGFRRRFEDLAYYADLLRKASDRLASSRPDVCVPVDSPALHLPLSRIAHAHGIPVVHFVTPQLWAWGPWRARDYKRAVDRALSILPFEPAWFERRGVPAAHVGHPQLDVLPAPPERFAAREKGGRHTLVLLPGSRRGVIGLNLPWMLAAAHRLRGRERSVRVAVVHERPELREPLEAEVERAGASGWARVETGNLHESLARATSALAVSGTILLDLLHHRIPAVVVYRLKSASADWLSRFFVTVPWISSVNLLAGKEAYPEFCFHGDGPQAEVDAALRRCLTDEAWRSECARLLDLAWERLGPRGAADRAAAQVLDLTLEHLGMPGRPRPDSAARGSGSSIERPVKAPAEPAYDGAPDA